MPLRISVPRISDVLPLPGVSELESAGRGLLRLLKDSDIEHDKRATLSRRLESLIRRANELQNLPELTSQLLEVQKQFEVVGASKSRLGIRAAQRKLAIWDELKAKLDERMEMNMLDLWAETRREAHIRPIEHNIIPSYEITNEVEISAQTLGDSCVRYFFPSARTLKKTVRAGRFKKRSIAYLTFAADSEVTLHKLVQKEMKAIFQLQHVNVAKFVGVTQGYSGLNGIVVAMDGVNSRDFVLGTHSGAVWAKYIKGFEAFEEWAPEQIFAERISVAPDGHVTIFPGRSGRIHPRLHGVRCSEPGTNPAQCLIMEIYKANYELVSPAHRHAFLDALPDLGLGFNELQVTKIAAACNLFPLWSDHTFPSGPHFLPHHGLEAGGFVQAICRDGEHRNWEGLERSHHVRDTDWYHGLDCYKSVTPDGAEWLTFSLPDLVQHDWWRNSLEGHMWWSQCINKPFRFAWQDIFAEAQEISERSGADLENIYFAWGSSCHFHFTRPIDANWDKIPTSLYHHRSPRSANPYEAEGFYSADRAPDGGVWQEQLESQGWKLKFEFVAQAYRMGDGWDCQYEKQLQEIMEATPGSYPDAQIEELQV